MEILKTKNLSRKAALGFASRMPKSKLWVKGSKSAAREVTASTRRSGPLWGLPGPQSNFKASSDRHYLVALSHLLGFLASSGFCGGFHLTNQKLNI